MNLDVLNQRFDAWLAKDYHHKVHSSIKEAPMTFYMRQSNKIKHFNDPRIIDEASPMFIGKVVDIRYKHESPLEIYIYENNVRIHTCPKVIMKDNAVAKRNNNTISYSSMGGASRV